jgi:hypothetical protein
MGVAGWVGKAVAHAAKEKESEEQRQQNEEADFERACAAIWWIFRSRSLAIHQGQPMIGFILPIEKSEVLTRLT